MEYMPNSSEGNSERILTNQEVMNIISRYEKGLKLERELYDEKGLYFMELTKEIEGTTRALEYTYTRKGRFPNKIEALMTSISVTIYDDGIPCGGTGVADFDDKTGEWRDAI